MPASFVNESGGNGLLAPMEFVTNAPDTSSGTINRVCIFMSKSFSLPARSYYLT